jgi:hypothetical protein
MTDAFFAQKVTLPFDSSTLLADAEQFDRQIIVTYLSDTVLLAFEPFTVGQGIRDYAQVEPTGFSDRLSFTLPAGQEFWAGHTQDGETVTMAFIVTR